VDGSDRKPGSERDDGLFTSPGRNVRLKASREGAGGCLTLLS